MSDIDLLENTDENESLESQFSVGLNSAEQYSPEENCNALVVARQKDMTPSAVLEQKLKPESWLRMQNMTPEQLKFFVRNQAATALLYNNPKSLKLADAVEKAKDRPKEKEPEWKSFERIEGVEAGQWDGNTAIDEYVESQLKEFDKTHPKPNLRRKKISEAMRKRGGVVIESASLKALGEWEKRRKTFESETRLAARRSWIRDYAERFGDMDDATFQQAKMILQRTGGFYPNVLNKLKDAVASGNVVEAMTSDDIHKALNLPGAKRNPFMQWKIAKYAEDLYGRQGRMLGLMDSQYPSWRDEDEKMQTLMFNKLASEAGIDISDMSIDMIRQKGFLDSDFAAPLNAFGLRDLALDLFNDRLSLEDGGLYRKNLKDVTAEMPPEVVGDFLSRFKNQVDTERGQTWLSSITEGVGSSLAYSLEFMIMNAMLPGGGSQIGKILKPLTLAKDAEGYVARWTPEGIKLMLKALGVDAVETTAKNVGLPMLAKTALATEKRDADDRFPLLFQNENGETVRVENDQIDPWIVKFGQEFIGNWIEHFTENLGEFLPEMPWEKSVKNLGLGLKDNMTAAQKVALVEKALKNSGFARAADKVLELSGWNGFTAEMFEEYASKFARALLTDASKAVDMPVLDMKENSYLGDLVELRDTAVTIGLQSLLMNGLHLATNSALRKRIEKDIMASNRVREALKETGLVEQDVETARETLKTEGTFEGKKVYLRTADVAALMQKHGEFFKRLGISEDEVQDAMQSGEPTMAFNLEDLTIEGARAEGGEEFYRDVVGNCFDDVTLTEKKKELAETADTVKQLMERYFNPEEQEKREKAREENKAFVDEMVGKVAEAVRSNPATNYEVERAGRMFTTLLNMNTNTGATMEQRKEYADNILNSYLENPEAFTGDYVKNYSAFLKDGVVQTLANLFGVKLHVWTDAELEEEKKRRSQVEGGISNFAIHGKYKDGTIYINPHSSEGYMKIFGHELNHYFKQSAPELYQSLKEVFDEAVKTAEGERSQEAQALWDEISRTYPEFKDSLDDLQEEYQGDLLGMMFTDRKFLGTLAEALERKKKGMGALLLEKMRDVLLHILRYLGGVGRYESVQMFNDVSRLYNDISDVLADYAANREALVKAGVKVGTEEDFRAEQEKRYGGTKWMVGDLFSTIRKSLVREEGSTPLFDELDYPSFEKSIYALYDLYLGLPSTIVAADGKIIRIHPEEKDERDKRFQHIITMHNTENGKPKFDYLQKIRWLPRIPETLKKAQVKLLDNESGNFIYARAYKEGGIHTIVVSAHGLAINHEYYDHDLITQFFDNIQDKTRRDYFKVIWEYNAGSTTTPGRSASPYSSNGGVPSEFVDETTLPPSPEKSSQGGKNLITRSGVESVFRKLGGDENPSVAVFASHNAALEALKNADGITVWKTMAEPLRELAADLVSRKLAVPQLEEALPKLNDIPDLPAAFERYMADGTAHDDATRDALSALKMLQLSVWQGNGRTMEVDEDVRTELDARLVAGECVNNMLPFADVRAALQTLEGTGVPGNGLPYDTLHLLQRVEAQVRDRQEQYLKRTLNTLRRVWRGEAKELMAQDRDYQAWERIKAGGGLDYNMVKTLVGKEKTKALRERGLLSKVADSVNAAEIDYNNLEESKTVNPYELFGSLGYTDVFEMVDALLKMATPTAFVKEYVNQNSEEWLQGQGWKLDEEALGNSQVIDGVRLLEKMLAEKTNWPLFSQSFRNDAYNRVHSMKVADIVNDNKALTDARLLINDIVHASGKKEADAGAIMDAVGALRLQLEILRQKAALKKDIGKIQRQLLKDAHAKKGTIHSFYHNALKELAYVFGISKSEPETMDGRQRAKAALEATDENDTMERRVWGDWMLSSEKRKFKDLSVEEFEELADFVRAVSGVGRSLVTEDKQSTAARNAETLQSFIADNADKEHKYTKHPDAGAAEKARHYVNMFNAIWTKLWRFMGEAGPTLKKMYDTLSVAANREMELREKAIIPLNKAVNEISLHLGDVNLDNLPELPENSRGYQKWTPEMAIMVVLHMGTETGRQRLRDGFGWTDAQLNQIASALPSAILSQLNNVWQIMGRGEMTQADREEFLKENYYELKTLPPVEFQVLGSDGVTVNMTGGYVPISYLYSNRGHDVTIGYNAMSVYATPSSIHERAQEIRDVAPLVLSWGTLLSNISDRCHYSTHRLALRDIFAVVTNKDFRRTYGETQSFERYAAMMQILRHIANPTQDEHKALNFLERFGKSMLVPCSLAFNLSSVGMQLTSLTVGSLEQGGHFGRAVLSMCIHPLETMAAAREKSPMMRERADMIDIDMHKATTIFNQSKLKKVQETFNLLGYYMMKTVDSFVATIDFTAAYEKAIAEGRNEAEAIAYAEDFVARTQGATRAMDVSTVSLSPLGRMITPFFTAVCAQQNVAAHDLFDADKNAMQKAIATTLNLLLPALMAGAIRFLLAGGAGDDDDKKERARTAMIRELMTQPVAGIPVLRDVADFMAGQISGRRGGSVIEAGWVEAINDMAGLIGDGVKAAGDGEWQYTCYIMADAVSRMTRTPLVIIYNRQQRLLENLGINVPNIRKELKGK